MSLAIGTKCPGCGGLLTARITERDESELGHTLPTCAEFDAVQDGDDALALLRKARMAAQAKAGIGAA